jgi:hypothetical protein
VALQLYRFAAGGSRERLEVWQFFEWLHRPRGIDAMGKTSRWVILGSRLLAIFSGVSEVISSGLLARCSNAQKRLPSRATLPNPGLKPLG